MDFYERAHPMLKEYSKHSDPSVAQEAQKLSGELSKALGL